MIMVMGEVSNPMIHIFMAPECTARTGMDTAIHTGIITVLMKDLGMVMTGFTAPIQTGGDQL